MAQAVGLAGGLNVDAMFHEAEHGGFDDVVGVLRVDCDFGRLAERGGYVDVIVGFVT